MKRTKQAYYRPHPTGAETKQCSGLNFLIGEDVPYYMRQKDYQENQKLYLDEQVQEKQYIKEMKKQTAHQFDQQLLKNNHQRGQLELQKAQRLFEMEKAHDLFNLQAANDRKLKQKLQRERIIEEQRRQLQLLNQRKVKRWLPGQSQ